MQRETINQRELFKGTLGTIILQPKLQTMSSIPIFRYVIRFKNQVPEKNKMNT